MSIVLNSFAEFLVVGPKMLFRLYNQKVGIFVGQR